VEKLKAKLVEASGVYKKDKEVSFGTVFGGRLVESSVEDQELTQEDSRLVRHAGPKGMSLCLPHSTDDPSPTPSHPILTRSGRDEILYRRAIRARVVAAIPPEQPCMSFHLTL
jgi:hypothetical protein